MVEILRQAGAIPFQVKKNGLKVLLITSRDTGRWVIPKGGVEPGFTAREAAAQEAFEEAGIKGVIDDQPLGFYTYGKKRRNGTLQPASVEVYALLVQTQLKKWPEQHERRLEWMNVAAAMAAVSEPGVAALLQRLEELHSLPHQAA